MTTNQATTNPQACAMAGTTQAPAPAHDLAPSAPSLVRVGVLINGRKTSVSVPPSLLASLADKYTLAKARAYIREAAQNCQPRPGYSRSLLVRAKLEQTLTAA